MSNTIEAVLFTLTGQGDKNIFLAPRSALEWCNGVRPGQCPLPEQVKQDLVPFLGQYAAEVAQADGDVLEATPGSASNDAALFLAGRCRIFDSVRKALAYANEQGWTVIDDEYDGYIY